MFASFEGHFLGLSVCNNDPDSAVYECDVDDDVSDDDERQFDDMMRNLGAVGLLEKYDT